MKQFAPARALPLLLLFLLLLPDCRPDGPKNDLTPEAAVLQWQQFIDHNRFDEARKLSLRQALEYVDYLDEITGEDTVGVRETELLDLKCEVRADSAVCRYYTLDEIGEKVADQLVLRKAKGQWRIDQVEGFDPMPPDTLRPGDEDLVFPPGDSTELED